MPHQIWTLKAKIQSDFCLVADELLSSATPPHPTVIKFALDPEFGKNDVQTGRFNLEITLDINPQEETLSRDDLVDFGKDLVRFYVDLLTFLSGRSVSVLDPPPELTFNYPGTNNYRKILLPSQHAVIAPPVELNNTLLFSIALDPKTYRALSWLGKAVEEPDIVNSFISLCTSLEILSNLFDYEARVTRKCPSCGYEYQNRPATNKRIEHFLVDEVKYSQEEFKTIWDARQDILHGGFPRAAKSTRALAPIRNNLYLALVKGLKMLMNLPESSPPNNIPPRWTMGDSTLDVEYTVPPPS